MVRQAPLRHDGASPGDDAGHPPRGHRDVAKQHASVHGEIVHALLALLDERVAIDLPRQVFGPSTDLLERLVNRHRPDRHGGVANDPLARGMDVLAGRKVHHGVGAPQRGPLELLHLVLDRGPDGGVADVRVDLHQEVAADDHRLELEMVDVRRDDGAAPRHFRADEFGRKSFPRRNELHLGGNLATASVRELCADMSRRAARLNPWRTKLRQPGANVMALRPARVVQADRRLTSAERHFAHRNFERNWWPRLASTRRCASQRLCGSSGRPRRNRS